jgi:hypothetical protein
VPDALADVGLGEADQLSLMGEKGGKSRFKQLLPLYCSYRRETSWLITIRTDSGVSWLHRGVQLLD